MDRRNFLVKSVGGLAVSPRVLALLQESHRSLGLPSQTEIAQAPLRPEDDALLKSIPTESVLRGYRHTMILPDTLDLADRLAMAISPLTNRFFPSQRWALGFAGLPTRPFAVVNSGGTDAWLNTPPKFIETLAFCRLATGSDLNLEVDRKIIATQLGLLGNDGLTYCPPPPSPGLNWPQGYASLWAEGRLLLTLSVLAQVDRDARWVDIARKKVQRLLELSGEKEGFRFFAGTEPQPGATHPSIGGEPAPKCDGGHFPDNCACHFEAAYAIGAIGHGAGRFYRVTGYRPALQLCQGLAQWALARIFTRDDGRYLVDHFYHGLYALIAVAEYGSIMQDENILRRVEACYQWAREGGAPLVGWYGGYTPGGNCYEQETPQQMEICALSNLVILALYLIRNGIGDYWDDVDRWVRNQYAAAQMTNLKFLDRLPEHYFSPPPKPSPTVDTRDIAVRNLGAYFTAMTGNDGLPIRKNDKGEEKLSGGFYGCCVTNGPRALYFVWDSMISGSENDVRLHLLLNRTSEWVDVSSFLPVQGRVVLSVKKARRIAVRLPEGVDHQKVVVSAAGRRLDPKSEGRYLALENLEPGAEVTLQFSLPERVLNRIIARRPYKLTLRGSQVVAIDPPGKGYPLYQEQPQGQLIEKECFVATRKVIW